MTSRCPACEDHGTYTRHGETVICHCIAGLEVNLGDIPALAEDLDVTLSRQTAVGYREGGRNAEEPLPFNVNASAAAAELHATLVSWARDLHGVDPSPTGPTHQVCDDPSCDWIRRNAWPVDTSTAVSRWLLVRMAMIRRHPTEGQLRDEIGYAVYQARKAVDRPKNRSRVLVGPCLEDNCVGELWAAFPLADFDPNDPTTHATISCTECGVAYPADQWLRVGTRLLQRRAS